PARRAERESRARARRPGLRDGLRRGHDDGRREGAAQRPEGAGGVPRGIAPLQSIRVPLAFTTRSYFASSVFTNAPNCSGVVGAGSAISVAIRALSSGDARASTKARFSRAVTSACRCAGPNRPNQVPTSKPGSPDSATVGSSGIAVERLAVVTAIAFSLPV